MALLLCPGSEEDGWITLPSSDRAVASNHELQRNGALFSVLDTSDGRFQPLLKMLDSLSCELHKAGIGAIKQSAKVIDEGHEIVFWEKHLLGYGTPNILPCTVLVSILRSEVSRSSKTSCLNSSAVCL